MAVFKAIFWGATQGITEFIPVSSSGHLVIIPRLFGIDAPDLTFNIALHLGTLSAVLIFFRKDILTLFTTEKRLGSLVLLATLPIIIIGLLFADKITPLFQDPAAIGLFLIINGAVLMAGHLKLKRLSRGSPLRSRRLVPRQAVTIGIAQALALMPGISRSGLTIITGISSGLDRKDAYRFSFLLFIPAALSAFMYSIKESMGSAVSFDVNMLAAVAVSAVFGILALKLLYGLLIKARLYILGIYCIAIGLLTMGILR